MKKINHNVKKLFFAIVAILVTLTIDAAILLCPRPGSADDSYVWSESGFDIAEIHTMQTDGEFRILQLTDIQLDMPFQSRKTLERVIDTLIEENDPDLIVLTGDNVAGPFSHFYVDYVIELMDSYKIPWAPVFGNHDRELNANLYYQAEKYEASEYCLFKEGPSDIHGVGNYVINIMNRSTPIYTLFMMDSNGNRDYVVDGETVDNIDYIYPDQIEWYEDNVSGISAINGTAVPSMAFFHIPLMEYKTAYDLAIDGSDEATLLGGERRENECPPLENTGFFDSMKINGTTHVFVGHDHINDYTVLYQGIYLTYGVKTGNFSYHEKDKFVDLEG
jgi:3',5'-cyclic AMP phosphodiesterase CpdA